MTRRSSGLSLQHIAGAPLRALTRFGGSQLAARFNLHEPVERAVFEATRVGAQAIAASVAFVRSTKSSEPKRLAPTKAPGLFDLTPTEDQELMRDSMRRFADEVLRPAARGADDAAAPPDEVLQQGHALGLAGLVDPRGARRRGDGAVVGDAARSSPRSSRGATWASPRRSCRRSRPCRRSSSGVPGAQQARYLPPFLGDQLRAGGARGPRAAARSSIPMRPRAGAVRSDEGGWKLYGEKALVPLATKAELFVVAAEVRGLGARLFVVERGTPGLHVESEPAMGLRGAGLGRLRFEGARVPEDALLGEVGGDGAEPMGAARRPRTRRVGRDGGRDGAGGPRLRDPVRNERKAFGEPISNRQGVAFPIADIAIELEGMRLLVHRAASRIDRGSPAGARPRPSRACSARARA